MGCVHTPQTKLAIEECGNPSHVQSIVKKTRKNNQSFEIL